MELDLYEEIKLRIILGDGAREFTKDILGQREAKLPVTFQ
jgi:hypothetical protein